MKRKGLIFRVTVLLGGLLFMMSGMFPVEGNEGILSSLDIGASGSLDFYSRYAWRGFTLDTDPVVQPGFSLSGYGLTFSFWSSWDAGNNDSANSDEIDYAIDYTKEFDNFSISMGHTYYDFPGADLYSKEFYIGFGLSDALFSPSLTYYHDYGDEKNGGGDGDYVVLALSESFPIIEEYDTALDLGVSVGYNHELFIDGDGGDAIASVGLTIPLTENLTMSPNANYAVPFYGLSDSDDGNQDSKFYGGVSFSYAL